MILRILASASLLALSLPALAAADLATSIAAPSGVYVYQSGTYNVTVANVGNQNASAVSLVVQLPETNTSPTVHVMGVLGAKSASCSQSGTTLVCSLGLIKKGKSASIFFDIAMPESADPLVIGADSSTTSSEPNQGNNEVFHTASLLNYAVSFTAPRSTINRHCTGTGLASFYECALYPSSISSHDAVLHADGSITFPAEPDYGGSWVQLSSTHLAFEYTYLGDVVAEFEGYGVDSGCWEGLTTFPGSSYVSPYEVCLN